MDADKGSWHWWVARQEQGPTFLDESRETVANRIKTHVGSVVSNSDDDCSRFSIGAARFAEIEPNELDHVRFEEVNVPPRSAFHLGQTARFRREEVARAAIDGPLRNATTRYARLHRCLAGGNVKHTKWDAGGCPGAVVGAEAPRRPQELESWLAFV